MHALWNTIARGRLTADQLSRLDVYLDVLIETNARLNLTRITDRADAEVRHVADALTLLDHLPAGTRTLADVGTGGGVPGAILAIARPEIAVTLIDSTKKKLDAVAAMCERPGVTNVRTLHTRAENATLCFDVVTARAVADLATLVGWCRGLIRPGGVLLAMKGPKAAEEVAAAAAVLKRAKLTAEVVPVGVPELAGHCVVRLTR